MSRRAWAVIGGVFAAIVIIVAIVLATGDDSGSDKKTSSTTSSTAVPPTTAATLATTTTSTPSDGFASPEDAIADYLQDKGFEYAGDCAGTDLETDVGKWCSGQGEDPDPSDNTRIYFIGPTFSEGAEQLTLTQGSDGKWRVTASEATPPVGG